MFPDLAQPLSPVEARALDPLTLAYVGDAVQSLYVRATLALTQGGAAGKLHRLAIRQVSASAQAEELSRVRALFTPEEEDVYRTARNHKTKSSAKNASTGEYHKATGLEAVWGYLYLTGQQDRLVYLLAQTKESL